ncbi:MAG: sigma-70 family RNA polymerase sigma factor [Melioribacteraceae bacterium]|nr:sigma-70 family RNA polymerase sigma factor [Melioribacteraceae bacterium]
MIENDNKLIIESLNGKINSFGKLVEKYQNKMFNLAIQITNDSDASNDITQDVFIKAYEKLNTFDQNKKFFSWIYRITLNAALNYKNHLQFTKNFDNDSMFEGKSASEEIETNERSKAVQKTIKSLDDKYRTLVILKHYQELSYEEITEITKLPIGKIKSRLYIARDNLRKSLEGINK